MVQGDTKLRAIDLYSGVGGWSLGLRLAGIDVIASYELWGPANETNFKNNVHQAQTVDIRRLSMGDLPKHVDIVVGSPPCTQFSYSNRGGGGDIADGLEDIVRFLTIVDHLKPRFWAMENVPRVAKIIIEELKPGGVLERFSHLGIDPHEVNMADYGLPQRRRRCIAGNFDPALLAAYKAGRSQRTLGEIVEALAADPVVDPIFGISIPHSDLIDHVEEDILNTEETRINRANKTTHTVYNSMPFPDPLDRSVRTITATCTRVSRESIVIAAPKNEGSYRRLTLRERASLQGFPITFQFYGANYGQKLRMIGNAVPPAFAFIVGQILQGHAAPEAIPLAQAAEGLTAPTPVPVETPPDRAGARYPATRTFKFAIPSLQLKSGVRFELMNDFSIHSPAWRIAFYFGTSKSIQSIALGRNLRNWLLAQLPLVLVEATNCHIEALKHFVEQADIAHMQSLWAHKGVGGTRAFMLLDAIDSAGAGLTAEFTRYPDLSEALVEAAIAMDHGPGYAKLPGLAKLARNAPLILAGLLASSIANPILEEHADRLLSRGTKRAEA
jgi:DNA (cytosine-5)-methyltransferase 1